MNALDTELLPDGAVIGPDGVLTIAGCDVLDLAKQYGTPLFVYDEAHLRERCREAVAGFGHGAAYATKAFLCSAMARIAHEEGMLLDVATGGEMRVALAAGVPGESLVVHGNNKSLDELRLALEVGAGRIVVDSFEEMDRIDGLVGDGHAPPDVLVRINPGIEAHTHEYLRTGAVDSKFGFGLAAGRAAEAVERVTASASMQFKGVHAHIGSQVFETSFFERAVNALAPFVGSSGASELSVGGGLEVAYVAGEVAPSISEWADAVNSACATAGVEAQILAEPGRSIVAAAAVTLYTVGTIKEIDGVRTYVAVDGGMSDNPRPVLYGSGYEAFLPRSTAAARPWNVRIVGKHCESGDVIVHEAAVPEDTRVGDVLCTPVTGAYGHSMGSNYNMVRRPAVVFVNDGGAREVVRRETWEDLMARDVGV
jgi:diaminopimelate decarboxylase